MFTNPRKVIIQGAIVPQFDGLVARNLTAVTYLNLFGSLSVRHSRRVAGRWQTHEGPFQAEGLISCRNECLASKKRIQVETMDEMKRAVSRSIGERLV